MPGTPRTVPDVQFSRIRFFGCTRFRGAKQRLQANTLRRLTSVRQGRALLTRSRTRGNGSHVSRLCLPPRRLSHGNVPSMAQRKKRVSEREFPCTPSELSWPRQRACSRWKHARSSRCRDRLIQTVSRWQAAWSFVRAVRRMTRGTPCRSGIQAHAHPSKVTRGFMLG